MAGLLVFGAPAAAALLTGRRARSAKQAVMAALGAGARAALLVSAARAECDRLPARSGAGHRRARHAGRFHGGRAAARELHRGLRPLFGLLVFGASLAAVLWVMARPPTRAGTTVALLVALGLPAFGLAASARDFPGAAGLAAAALAVVIGAVATARPGRPV